MIDSEQFNSWLNGREDEHLEFKEAKQQYDFEKLVQYCVALANEGGGKLILGVTNALPHQVVGSQAFSNLEKVKLDLMEKIHIRINVEEYDHPEGRVVIFDIPSRPIGWAIQYEGAYWMRIGGSLSPMTAEKLQKIFAEGQPDFTSEICEDAKFEDLDPSAISDFRIRWERKSGLSLGHSSNEQLLENAELVVNGKITYAVLILLGSKKALGRYLPQAEVIFEYRSSEASIEYQQRKEFRVGFFLFFDELWNLVNIRNDLQHFQDGLFIWDIPTFNEEAVREALLNAISHRDYRLGGSIFIRQYPRKMEIISPGGLPSGITPDNIYHRQNPRNRRIAESFGRCGLVERSGQGFDKIIVRCISESKPRPDFSKTDDHQVCLTLFGTVQDPGFLRYLEKVGQAAQKSFSVEDFMILDLLSRGEKISATFIERLQGLKNIGVIESIGRGKGTKYILSKQYYDFTGKKGIYTRKRGLDTEHNKALLLEHLQHHHKGFISDFEQALPTLSRNQIHSLLKKLKADKKVRFVGSQKTGYWEKLPG